jgi:hypothetical protein
MNRHARLALSSLALALAGCSHDSPGPTDVPLAQARSQPSATCLVTPSGAQYSVLLQWNRAPTKEIVIIRETIPGPPPHTEVLPTQKRKGSVTVLLDFFPTVAFFVARNQTDFVRATCSSA